ncbi:hypothetical protein [Streptacidiphilus sp. P02-A3a]|uniref:hypothetical protein n=1 Tax=Streptacidiphilus sp. P02-A3a TaxID=2704468 RepID=UPI0015F87B31|nr:hypothetical protein [Streptacidiphilus sp. P02-A3a]QMU72697.1 hypothetical protein GXP74_35075 [Streptacidiphilus sp. P02-A3a]
MAKIGSSIVVTGLTASALAVVTMLAVQAKSDATVTAPGTATGTVSSGPTAGKGGKTAAAPALPAGTGTDKRVVYSLSQRRVWLVDAGAKTAEQTFVVQPSAVSPLAGSYSITAQDSPKHLGSDGVEIENVVLFASNQGIAIGFSSAVDGSMASPPPSKHTGGIRETVADGKALYAFTTIGMPVIVVG